MTATPLDLRSVIAGERLAAADRPLASVNPSRTAEVVAQVSLAGRADFTAACRAAQEAQAEWARVPAPIRGQVIANIGELVAANKEALARSVTRDIGKTLGEARGEVQEIIDTCEYFRGEGRRLYGQTVPSEMPDKQLFTFRNPLGVAAIITAGNFPVAVPSWYIIPALLTGNAVVWKPAEYSAACAWSFYELFSRAGIPRGVLNIVYADGEETFAGLEQALGEGLVDKVGFTGSSAVGARIGELCGRHLQTPCLELGGKNPMVVTEDADLELAAEGALFSGFGTAGQRCTSLGTAIVHEGVHDRFVELLAGATAAARVGDPTRDVLYGPMINERFAARYESYLGWIGDHHRVLGSTSTGRISAANPREGFVGDPGDGLFYHPVILDGVRPEDKVFTEETFGPIIGVTTYRHLEEAVELADLPGYGLSCAIYTTDPKKAFDFRSGIGAGMVSVNNSTSGAEAHLPFGGNGRSGNGGRLSGMWVLDQFTRWQSMNWDYSGRLQKAQMDVLEIDAELGFRLD
ncbi:aldehyde dehydrogenase (NAD+) [Spinactinospora alkalitolerans]|uniref:aldehyde dehydrogenase (NAD(+)) n=1 Tax=Spinactinospora alkalitolerans TaxID=687207 RepID=A0A852TTH6_9ACTN|nr:aldehyde dehydrogenase family protein [Spinactinospora alkalitolerans]NYE47319.1 aldehyde dehydrogenase (NAD+) [Spinactinospora alkalitolerans]